MHRRIMLAAALALAPLAAVSAQLGSYNPEPGPRATVVIRNARIFPVSGPVIPNGSLVIADGVIRAVGVDVDVPAGAEVIDATGLSVYPGMMESVSTLGLSEIAQGANATRDQSETGRFNPNAQALWGINPHSAHIGVSRVVGITHAVSAPSGGIVSGQAALINLGGFTARGMAVVPDLALMISLPSQGGGGFGFGGGRFGGGQGGNAEQARTAALDSLERLLDDAVAYGKAVDAANTPRPASDVILAALVPAVRGEMPVGFRAESQQDIRAAVEFAEKRGLKPVIVGGRDSWRIADYLKEHDVPVLFTATMSIPNRDDDPYDANYAAASKLAAAGVRFAISSGEDDPDIRNLPYVAGMAAAFGLGHDAALRAVTLSPAEIFGVADRLGSLEVGKVANVVVTNGDILEARTDTKYLFIDGRPVPLDTKHSELYEMFKDRR
ncbi:MAG TPA: amidohydrolase family protein [Gemmatimonadales bacterium]|nr:amidohydrolase family protein [Gemmatimonadales bacterium]